MLLAKKYAYLPTSPTYYTQKHELFFILTPYIQNGRWQGQYNFHLVLLNKSEQFYFQNRRRFYSCFTLILQQEVSNVHFVSTNQKTKVTPVSTHSLKPPYCSAYRNGKYIDFKDDISQNSRRKHRKLALGQSMANVDHTCDNDAVLVECGGNQTECLCYVYVSYTLT